MYPSRFFETSRFHCRTKEPPGANLHLSASHSRARGRERSPPHFPSRPPTFALSLFCLPPFVGAKSFSSSRGPLLAWILLEIAARVLVGAESEG